MSFTKFEPVLAALVLADIPIVTAFVNELASAHTSTITSVILAAGIAALNAAAVWARSKVTPVAKI